MVMSSTLAFAAAPAEAQEEPALADEDIIVFGTKKFLSLQDTQTSVAVVTAEQIEDLAVFNVEDVLLRTANASTAGQSLNELSIRGIQLSGVGFTGTGQTANVYVDGSPNSPNANQGAYNLWDVAQVEVLRGPQSTTQGRNALSGAVIITTADPEYDFGLKARFLIGNEKNRQFSGMVTGPILKDQIAFRLAADYREIDFGVVNLDTGNNTRFQDALTLRGKLLFEPSALEGLRVEVGVQHVETEFGEFNQTVAPGPVTDPAFDAFDPFGDETFGVRERLEFNDVTRVTLDTVYSVSDNWSLYAIGTYERSNRDTNFGAGSINSAVGDTLTAELRAAFDYGALSGWIGGYFFDLSIDSTINFSSPLGAFGLPVVPPDSLVTILTDTSEETRNYALFGDVTYELNETWSINIGARFDWEEFSDTGLQGSVDVNPETCVVAAFVPGIGGLPCAALIPVSTEPPQSAQFNAFLPRASVIYKIDELRSVSLNVARGYRAGGSYIRTVPGEGVSVLTFDPEFITNYEIAVRTQWPDYGLTVNANLFYANWSDQQVTIPGPTNTTFDFLITNVGSSEVYGAEVDIQLEVNDALDLFASLGLLQTKFTDFPFAVGPDGSPANAADPQFSNLSGNEFNNAPNISAAIGFSYKSETGFFASGNVAYSGSQFSDVTNLEINTVDSYILVNARAGYRTGPLSFSIFVDNLFNDRFATRQGITSVDTGTGAVSNNANPFFIVNDPRVFGGEVTLSF
jgi:outer membrane receptor protein involved in Fe transport